MDNKVSITITTDKSVKIRITSTDSAAGKEAEGLNRLIKEVKGGCSHVVSQREVRASGKK